MVLDAKGGGLCRDGDTVQIRALEDGETLEIEDNYALGPSITTSATPIEASTLEGEDECERETTSA